MMYLSPTAPPWTASSSAAASRTVRVTANWTASPLSDSPKSGPTGVRPRVGFRPTRPHQAEGIRIEPPPSVACATGMAREATRAADPPLEPPELRDVSHGLQVDPVATGSV